MHQDRSPVGDVDALEDAAASAAAEADTAVRLAMEDLVPRADKDHTEETMLLHA